MPDQDLLPPGRRFDEATPPGLGEVLTSARRRRRVRAGVIGGIVGACAVAAVALLAVPDSSTGSLKTVTPAVSPTPPSIAHKEPRTLQPIEQPAAAATEGAPATSGQPAASARPGSTARATTSQGSVGSSGAIVGPPHRTTSYDATRTCDGTGPTPATGWCSYYTGATSGRPGQSVLLATDVCRMPGQSAGVLTSDNGEQADFAVNERASPSAWTWSNGRQFSPAHTSLTVAAGRCVEWFVNWNVVDDQGHPLAPGNYSLSATPLSSTGSTQADVTNPQTFTVTS